MTERVYLINDDNETYICMAKGLRTYGLGNVNILDKFLYESTVYSSPLRINDGIGIPENYVNVNTTNEWNYYYPEKPSLFKRIIGKFKK